MTAHTGECRAGLGGKVSFARNCKPARHQQQQQKASPAKTAFWSPGDGKRQGFSCSFYFLRLSLHAACRSSLNPDFLPCSLIWDTWHKGGTCSPACRGVRGHSSCFPPRASTQHSSSCLRKATGQKAQKKPKLWSNLLEGRWS